MASQFTSKTSITNIERKIEASCKPVNLPSISLFALFGAESYFWQLITKSIKWLIKNYLKVKKINELGHNISLHFDPTLYDDINLGLKNEISIFVYWKLTFFLAFNLMTCKIYIYVFGLKYAFLFIYSLYFSPNLDNDLRCKWHSFRPVLPSESIIWEMHHKLYNIIQFEAKH